MDSVLISSGGSCESAAGAPAGWGGDGGSVWAEADVAAAMARPNRIASPIARMGWWTSILVRRLKSQMSDHVPPILNRLKFGFPRDTLNHTILHMLTMVNKNSGS